MISIDPQFWIIRGGENHHKYGDPFTFSVTVVKMSETEIEFRALNGKMSLSDGRMIKKCFEDMGFKEYCRDRKK